MTREIVSQRFVAGANNSWPGVAAWLSQLENPEWRNLVTEILAESRPGLAEKNLKGQATRASVLKILRDKYIDRQMAALQQRLLKPETSEVEKQAAVMQKQKLRLLKNQPLAPKEIEGEA
jgi:hypothetical protein